MKTKAFLWLVIATIFTPNVLADCTQMADNVHGVEYCYANGDKTASAVAFKVKDGVRYYVGEPYTLSITDVPCA